MELRVHLQESIPAEVLRLTAAGRMCGNFVAVMFTSDPAVLRLRIIHEFGHFFGLSHDEKGTCTTYLRQCDLVPNNDADRLNPRQLDILERWDDPGSPYVRHWENP